MRLQCSCLWTFFACAASAVVPKVIDLFPSANASMASILEEHGNLANGKPTNMLVVFHLENCVFCEMTLGTILYNFGHDNIFNRTAIQPYQILVSYEGQPVAGHSYCQGNPSCIEEAKKLLGVDVSAITSFPSEYFYNKNGESKRVGDTACGIAVRGDADSRCTSTDLSHCADASVALDNWICNMYLSNSPSQDCSGIDWKRCESSDSALTQMNATSDNCTQCCSMGQWYWTSCCTNPAIKYLETCAPKCCQPSECCGAYGYPPDQWDSTCCHAAGNSMPSEDARCTGTCPKHVVKSGVDVVV